MSSQTLNDEHEAIKDLCMSLIKSNKTLGTKEASQFPTIAYNTIQHIYRYTFRKRY